MFHSPYIHPFFLALISYNINGYCGVVVLDGWMGRSEHPLLPYQPSLQEEQPLVPPSWSQREGTPMPKLVFGGEEERVWHIWDLKNGLPPFGVYPWGFYRWLVLAPKVSRARHEYLATHVIVLFSDVTDDARQTCGQISWGTDFQVIPQVRHPLAQPDSNRSNSWAYVFGLCGMGGPSAHSVRPNEPWIVWAAHSSRPMGSRIRPTTAMLPPLLYIL